MSKLEEIWIFLSPVIFSVGECFVYFRPAILPGGDEVSCGEADEFRNFLFGQSLRNTLSYLQYFVSPFIVFHPLSRAVRLGIYGNLAFQKSSDALSQDSVRATNALPPLDPSLASGVILSNAQELSTLR